jgi:hypothetical protein
MGSDSNRTTKRGVMNYIDSIPFTWTEFGIIIGLIIVLTMMYVTDD